MPVMRGFPRAVASTPAHPAPNVNIRTQAIVTRLLRRAGFTAFYEYTPYGKVAPVTPPTVKSSAFQPVSIFRSSWIIPALEPWATPAAIMSGLWFRAFKPAGSVGGKTAGGAVQTQYPRFGYVWGWNQPQTAPQVQPLTSTGD